VTAGDGTIRVWELDLPNRKIRPTECQLGQLKRIVKSVEVNDIVFELMLLSVNIAGILFFIVLYLVSMCMGRLTSLPAGYKSMIIFRKFIAAPQTVVVTSKSIQPGHMKIGY